MKYRSRERQEGRVRSEEEISANVSCRVGKCAALKIAYSFRTREQPEEETKSRNPCHTAPVCAGTTLPSCLGHFLCEAKEECIEIIFSGGNAAGRVHIRRCHSSSEVDNGRYYGKINSTICPCGSDDIVTLPLSVRVSLRFFC